MKNEIRQAIYDKYIAPTKIDRPNYIGVEIEMPVVNLSGQAVDEAVSIEVAEKFIKQLGQQAADQESCCLCGRQPEKSFSFVFPKAHR